MHECHICGKSYKRLTDHFKNRHKLSPDEVRTEKEKWRKLQEEVAATTNIVEDEKKQNVEWAELIRRDRARGELMNITASHFRVINASSSQQYGDFHVNIADFLRNLQAADGFTDTVDGDQHIHTAIENILKPSMYYLEQVNRVEMIRVANQLQNEFIY